MSQNLEIKKTDKSQISCDGENGSTGHPRVYLNIKPEIGFIACPYCSKRFELEISNRNQI